MAHDGPVPLSAPTFQVTWGPLVMDFARASGFGDEATIEYRSAAPEGTTRKLPGMTSGSVTLTWGRLKNDAAAREWLRRCTAGTCARAPLTIRLLDEGGCPRMVWTLADAWPTKVVVADLAPEDGTISIKEIQVAHRGLNVSRA